MSRFAAGEGTPAPNAQLANAQPANPQPDIPDRVQAWGAAAAQAPIDDIIRDAEGFEIEGEPEGTQTDRIWVRDGRGNSIEQEVPDDADD